ncbi:MAG: T9SS type A sorting domain-containing protein [Candidatus Delongbacteria bacterium]|jgi:hypothetical protein|nr:T9SS type A sorting domain-containing protein [Candidatus Delongbacteria bacterium]
MEKIILIILLFIISLSAQYEWSTPIQLSEEGVYPDIRYHYPAITVDSNSTQHAFWIKSIQIGSDLRWYSQIEYRKSYNDGISWSATENLTPDYTTERIYDMQALCDSLNNIHLIYVQTVTGSEYSRILHKRFYNNTWQEPVEVYRYYTSVLRTGMDNRNRIYATWFLGPTDTGTAYFSFCDVLSDTISWSPAKAISSDKQYGIRSFPIFDGNDNLYCAGNDKENYYPFLFKYDPLVDTWDYENILSQRAVGTALVLSSTNKLNVGILIGPTIDENQNYITTREIDGNLWSKLEYINDNNDVDKEMFIDKNDNIHLFELHFDNQSELIYTNNLNIVFNTEIVQSDSNYYFNYQDVYFQDSLFYTVYVKGEKGTNNTIIFFQTKQIEVGIEEEPCIISDIKLYQNYPNPFNNETEISFYLEETAEIELIVYNSKGEQVESVIKQKMSKGVHSINYCASKLNSGVYYYQLKIDGIAKDTKKMLYLK